MKWDVFRKTMELQYKLPAMKYKMATAQRILMAFLKRTSKPYVAFSTGKDSLVALDLVLSMRPDIDIVFHDEDWVIPGTIENLEAIELYYDKHIIRVRERYAADEFKKEYGQWPICWQPRAVNFEADHWDEIVSHYGWDGAIIALRSEESTQRAFTLRRPLRWNKTAEEWRVSPTHDWNYRDVWAYIIGKRLLYHPAYEKLIDSGVEPKFARIGPLTAVRVYQYGVLSKVKYLWPDCWNRFTEQNPCVSSEA